MRGTDPAGSLGAAKRMGRGVFCAAITALAVTFATVVLTLAIVPTFDRDNPADAHATEGFLLVVIPVLSIYLAVKWAGRFNVGAWPLIASAVVVVALAALPAITFLSIENCWELGRPWPIDTGSCG